LLFYKANKKIILLVVDTYNRKLDYTLNYLLFYKANKKIILLVVDTYNRKLDYTLN